ncbi:hypothetical protein SS1G_07362 [Sclerotinia sclerotiorum 1980 UF-70]|uniref:Uncharacterized protein n=1 Tax=Sclerotinia sclerotiorum (strain ATCC 18683 / 1980 / Ss-1) TaxID=665079 RepID=A7EPW3_SCLS1|nr:hypothetical protein SS1G_07362 [Sclerotinia sclerotiorum 1980 UF-70]EDO04879.1 hypothetical protein SS1G_07362 [Sclerotinia sclerotiorum 1980 UF-70]
MRELSDFVVVNATRMYVHPAYSSYDAERSRPQSQTHNFFSILSAARPKLTLLLKRMEGNVARQREANRKLVAENEHLLPKMRGSEKKRLEELGEEVHELDLEREQRSVFGKQKIRLRELVDGGVEEADDMEMDD